MIEESYVDNSNQQIQYKTPRLRLDSTMGVNDPVQVQIDSEIQEQEINFIDKATNAPKSFIKYTVRVFYNNVQYWAKITWGISEELKKYQYYGQQFIITREIDGKRNIMKVQPVGTVPFAPVTPVQATQPQTPQNPVVTQTQGVTPSNTLTLPKQAVNPVQPSLGSQQNPITNDNFKIAVNPTDALMQIGRGYINEMCTSTNPVVRKAVGEVANDYDAWKMMLIGQPNIQGKMISEDTLRQLYQEFSVQWNK